MRMGKPSICSIICCASGDVITSDEASSQEVLPAIKMLVGDWYVDELGVLTREITARD